MQEAAARVLEQQLVPLAPLLSDVVLVGGAAIPLWVDAPGAPPPRPTNDTDVIVATRTRVEYHRLGEQLRALDFGEVSESRVICRWRHRPSGGLYDVMPLDAGILGFSNRWYEDAFSSAQEIELPSGTTVRSATPAYLVATKLVAFADRGGGNHLASHDMYDIVALVDGCRDLVEQIRRSAPGLRSWIAAEFAAMIDTRGASDAVLNYVPYDAPAGTDDLLLARIAQIAAVPTA